MTCTINSFSCNPYGIFYNGTRVLFRYAGVIFIDQDLRYEVKNLTDIFKVPVLLESFDNFFMAYIRWQEAFHAYEESLNNDLPLITEKQLDVVKALPLKFTNSKYQFFKNKDLGELMSIWITKSKRSFLRDSETQPKVLQGLWYV